MHFIRRAILTTLAKCPDINTPNTNGTWIHNRRHFSSASSALKDMTLKLFHGSEHAKAYAAHRPSYPPALYQVALEYHSAGTSGRDLAVDICCGSGQSTLPLAGHFRRVIGLDHSQAQISNAPLNKNNVTFRVGPADDLSFLEDSSVDLMTCGQGLHWLDERGVYAEARRVLRPGGAFIAYGYGFVSLDLEEANYVIQQFHTVTLKDYWDPQRALVDRLYKDIHLPFQDFLRNHDLSIEREMDVGSFVDYLATFSAWQKLIKIHPADQTLHKVKQRLESIYEETGGHIHASWPLFVLMGRA